MLFHTVDFFVFLVIILTAFYMSPVRLRTPLLLIGSYYFYMRWNPKFILLLLTLTTIDYWAGQWIASSGPRRRKLALIVSLTGNLGFLGFFKYYNFLADNLALLIGRPPHSFFLDVVLPLGISFHTFQSMSYVIDVYRGVQEPINNPVDYALFISFFPQLVAGPIVRAREFFRDLYHWQPPTMEEVQEGVFLVMLGLVKKMVVADQFALVSDAYFKNIAGNPGMLTAWSGVFAFAMQIFFDFSGYTDMAIGLARLLGFHFPLNFARPYLSASITEFWRRWHISLSRWLRDYLYIPLGGNRYGTLMTYRNLAITMLLGGLWHGASWNFLIWGGYHGLLLGLERIRGRDPMSAAGITLLWPFRVVLTFVLVCIGWVFFRAGTLTDSVAVIRQMFTGARGTLLLEHRHFLFVGVALVLALLEEHYEIFERAVAAPRWAQAASLIAMFFTMELFGITDVSIPFVYFQF